MNTVSNEQPVDQVLVDDGLCISELVLGFPVKTIKNTVSCTFKVCNLSKVQGKGIFSEPIALREFLFKLNFGIESGAKNGERNQYAVLYIYCYYNGNNATWSLPCEVKVTFESAVGDSVTKSFTEAFNEEIDNWGWDLFVKWCELQDPKRGFLINDTLTIQVVITSTLLTREDTQSSLAS